MSDADHSPSPPMRLLIVVTHLLGSGHLTRAAAIAEAAARRGHAAMLASGGAPAPHLTDRADGVEIVQLPPVRSNGLDFKTLLDPEGAPIDAAYRARRIAALERLLETCRPEAIVTELYPFGRRILRDEFDRLLSRAEALSPRPRVWCSVRDILEPPSKPSRVPEVEAIVERRYDGVLAHGDPALHRLEASWPVGEATANRVRYTGYVAPPPPRRSPEGPGAGEILVSAGGGSVGDRLFCAALAAAADPRLEGRRWRLLVGGADRAARIAAFEASAGPVAPVAIEPVRPDFREMLGRAALSISQCGYNTALDLAAAGAPAVLVPFAEGGETEQSVRAQAFASRLGWRVIEEASLTPEGLADAAAKALGDPPTAPTWRPSTDGAAEAVRILERDVAAARASGRGG
ncbi:MAG: glycosyltransferase [Pseudomonadota bacterium]